MFSLLKHTGLLLTILLHRNLICEAVIAEGACPEVKGNSYDCPRIIDSLKPNASHPIKLNIYALLPSSSDVKMLNMFAFDVSPTIIAGFNGLLICNNYSFDVITVECGDYKYLYDYFYVLSVVMIYICFSNGPMFEITTKSHGVLLIDPNNHFTKKCPLYYFNEMYEHTSYTKIGSYFAIWGCYKMSEKFHDRGLWIFGGDQVVHRGDIERIVDDALENMHLNGIDGLKEGLIIRADQSDPEIEEICSNNTYYHMCYVRRQNLENWNWDQKKNIIVAVVAAVTVTFALLTTFICIKCIE